MRISRQCKRYGGAFALLGLLWIAGCSRAEVGSVAGKVSLDGNPVSGAVIVFENAERGVSVNAELTADGTYTVRTFDTGGLPPGEYAVAVRPGGIAGTDAPLAGEEFPQNDSPGQAIPARYHGTQTSGLRATVQAGRNPPFDFQLSSGR